MEAAEAEHSTAALAESSGVEGPGQEGPEQKTEESRPAKDQHDADPRDCARDTRQRTSTRLVKFQLFETKAVLKPTILSNKALLHPWIQSERDTQSHP